MSIQGKSYSHDSYGGKHDLNMGNKGSIDGTYQSAVDIVRTEFMVPCKVLDWNVSFLTGGTNFGADVFFYLGKSAGGTGAVSIIGTADPLQGTGTFADASVLDASVDSTTAFSTGDQLVFQCIGTVGIASIAEPHVLYTETFEAADSL